MANNGNDLPSTNPTNVPEGTDPIRRDPESVENAQRLESERMAASQTTNEGEAAAEQQRKEAERLQAERDKEAQQSNQ